MKYKPWLRIQNTRRFLVTAYGPFPNSPRRIVGYLAFAFVPAGFES
jgi:hypothetical protein